MADELTAEPTATAEERAAAAEHRCVELESELGQVRSQAQRLRQKVAMLEEVSLSEKASAGRAKQQVRELEEELKAVRAAAPASEERSISASSPRSRGAIDAGNPASQAEPFAAPDESESVAGVGRISWPAALDAAGDLGGVPYDSRLPAPEAAQKALSALRCALCSLNQFHRTCSELHSRLSHCPERRELLDVIENSHSWVGTNNDADLLRQVEESFHRAMLEMQSLQWGGDGLDRGEGWNIIGKSRARHGQRHRGVGSSELEQAVVAAAMQIFAGLSHHMDTLFPPLQSQRQLRERQEAVARAKAAAASEQAHLEAHLANLTSGSSSDTVTAASASAGAAAAAATSTPPTTGVARVRQDTDTGAGTGTDDGMSRDGDHLQSQSPSLSPEEGVPHVCYVPESVPREVELQSTVAAHSVAVDDTPAVAARSMPIPVVEKVEEAALAARTTAEAATDPAGSATFQGAAEEEVATEGVTTAAITSTSNDIADVSPHKTPAAAREPQRTPIGVHADQSEHDGAIADTIPRGQGSQNEAEAGEINISPAKAT